MAILLQRLTPPQWERPVPPHGAAPKGLYRHATAIRVQTSLYATRAKAREAARL